MLNGHRGEPMREIYVSTDIETDGPIPGPHSMLSFGSAAFAPDRRLVGTFEANLHTLPEAAGHPDTMACGGPSRRRGRRVGRTSATRPRR
jgi:hypothetical protein